MKKIILAIFMTVMLAITPSVVFASGSGDICSQTGFSDPLICGTTGSGTKEEQLMGVVHNVLNAIYGIIGVIAVVMIVIAGVKYTTSQGDPGKVQSAKNTILYSIIGLVIAIMAFAITNFIINALV